MNGITRPRLHAIFQEAVKASGADVRLGVTVDAVAEDGRRRRFSGRLERRVRPRRRRGRDPLASCGSLVFPDAPEPEYTGQIVWRYNVPRPEGSTRSTCSSARTARPGFVPLAPDLMYILFIEAVAGGRGRRCRTSGSPRSSASGSRSSAARSAEIRDTQITDASKVVVPAGRVAARARRPGTAGGSCSIGDAAHATSPHVGQGGAMAIEDAIVLAEEVTADGDARGCARSLRRAALSALPGDLGDLAPDRDLGDRAHAPPEADFVGLTIKSVHVTAAPV